MDKGNRRNRVTRLLGSCAVLALALLLLAACGGGSNSSSGTTSTTSSSTTSSSTTSTSNAQISSGNGSLTGLSSTTFTCDQMTKVIISEHTAPGKADQYIFTPSHVTIKTGEFITFLNQSDEVHVLVATPSVGLINNTIDRNQDQPVQFTKAGTYILESQDARHRATMQVTVLNAAGTTCGITTPNRTITFTEKHVQGQPVVYALTPTTVNLNAGQFLTLVNKTPQVLNFSCRPSANQAQSDVRVGINTQQVLQFARVGQYTCSNSTSPRSVVIVRVH